ncbi:MAG: CRTAC1 family protein [Acidobacteriaceae bacterium]|nr:CRTAC1 family protein [Acidobacteriaceae bacterium]MBV9306279.1 CRTAC1 family protein [Acidobacteriaceae bacterium]
MIYRCGALLLATAVIAMCVQPAPIQFDYHPIPFRLDSDETPIRHVPATMAGGVAVFDYNGDGRPDIFFTNGADIVTLRKNSPKYFNRLFRNDGNLHFTDVTKEVGLEGTGYDVGVAIADYDNDGHPDLFLAGVHRNTLYHNNGDGTFTDVTAKAGLDHPDPQYGPLWAVGAAWLDINNDGLLDLFVLNYLQWDYKHEPRCSQDGKEFYCHPKFYGGLPNQLFLNNGDGTFRDLSEQSGIRAHVGKGMGVAVADYDGDGRPDLFTTNDAYYNFLFHNVGGNRYEEVALDAGVWLVEDGKFVSGMGTDFRDIDNDGFPDIAFVALDRETFPVFRNTGKGGFEEVTKQSGMAALSWNMVGYGAELFDFDNDGWKDLFVTRGHINADAVGTDVIDQPNTVMRNIDGKRWQALTEEAGLTRHAPARHRGCAFGDLDGDGRVDVVVTAIGREAEIWINRSSGAAHWLDVALEGTKSNRDGMGAVIKIVTPSGTQWNHMTSAAGYASSSYGPVHFGLGTNAFVDVLEVRWPSGVVQRLENLRGDRVITVKEASR